MYHAYRWWISWIGPCLNSFFFSHRQRKLQFCQMNYAKHCFLIWRYISLFVVSYDFDDISIALRIVELWIEKQYIVFLFFYFANYFAFYVHNIIWEFDLQSWYFAQAYELPWLINKQKMFAKWEIHNELQMLHPVKDDLVM